MNKYSLSERVTHHTKMSDESGSRPTRKPGGATRPRTHRADHAARGRLRKTLNKVMWPILWFWLAMRSRAFIGRGRLYPPQSQDRASAGNEDREPVDLYPKRAADFLWKGARWLNSCGPCEASQRGSKPTHGSRVHGCVHVPVVDDREAEGELEMIFSARTAASANRLQRAHIHVHGTRPTSTSRWWRRVGRRPGRRQRRPAPLPMLNHARRRGVHRVGRHGSS